MKQLHMRIAELGETPAAAVGSIVDPAQHVLPDIPEQEFNDGVTFWINVENIQLVEQEEVKDVLDKFMDSLEHAEYSVTIIS